MRYLEDVALVTPEVFLSGVWGESLIGEERKGGITKLRGYEDVGVTVPNLRESSQLNADQSFASIRYDLRCTTEPRNQLIFIS